MRRLALAAAVTAALCACGGGDASRGLATARVVDLSHSFDAQTIAWPTEEGFVHERGFEGVTEKGYYYAAHRFRGPEHAGTHLDAPIHFHAEGWTVDEIPVERLMGPAVVVDVSRRVRADRNHQVGVDDLESFEAAHGRIPDGALVLLRTGFGPSWPDRIAYLGTDARGAAALPKLSFPGLHPEAARWLVERRSPRAVGIDTASIDTGRSQLFETHQILFGANVPAFENLANLEALPPTGFEVVALPMKIAGGSGAPLRAVAIIPDGA